MFASRLPPQLEPNRLSRALAAARRSGARLLDLTATNPTAASLSYPGVLRSALSDARAATYDPDPRGRREARAAIAAAWDAEGKAVDPDRLVLTASTSEAYSFLFKLLCDPGDAVLVPQPSYPLFDLLTTLDAVTSQPYRLDYHGAWSIDRPSLEAACTDRTRAVLVVSPNNPTGSMLRADDRAWLRRFCAARDLAIVADEVFAEYPLERRADACRAIGATTPEALTFALGGLSKSVGLPQLKLAWIVADGPDRLVAPALERLDVIADSYLSVSTPVQVAAPVLLDAGREVRTAIAARLRRNLDRLKAAAKAVPPVSVLPPEGGWSVAVRVPAVASEEDLARHLIEDEGVVVHPGYFFDFPAEAFLVISLLTEPETFDAGVARVLATIARSVAS
jgi:hypothetical protein